MGNSCFLPRKISIFLPFFCPPPSFLSVSIYFNSSLQIHITTSNIPYSQTKRQWVDKNSINCLFFVLFSLPSPLCPFIKIRANKNNKLNKSSFLSVAKLNDNKQKTKKKQKKNGQRTIVLFCKSQPVALSEATAASSPPSPTTLPKKKKKR